MRVWIALNVINDEFVASCPSYPDVEAHGMNPVDARKRYSAELFKFFCNCVVDGTDVPEPCEPEETDRYGREIHGFVGIGMIVTSLPSQDEAERTAAARSLR